MVRLIKQVLNIDSCTSVHFMHTVTYFLRTLGLRLLIPEALFESKEPSKRNPRHQRMIW